MLNLLLDILILFSSAFLVKCIISYILQENETKIIEYTDTNVRIGFGRQRGHTIVY